MPKKDYDSKGEVSVVLLGTERKNVFFGELCKAVLKYERHVHYPDIHYLTIPTKDGEQVVELNDPGLMKTGSREVALKRADFIILYYSENGLDTLYAIQNLCKEITYKIKVPVLILCDVNDKNEEISNNENFMEYDRNGIKRNYSMEKMTQILDNNNVINEGEKLAVQLRCTFMKINSSVLADIHRVMGKLAQSAISRNKRKKSLIKGIRKNFNSTDRSKSVDAIEEHDEVNYSVKDSKVCSVM